ncbi:hypothetical protein Emag_004481 [Eimeria magna]
MLLRRLVSGLHLQQKIAREAVRWAQELEVTFKAFSVNPAELQPRVSVAEDISEGTRGDDQRLTSSCKQAKHAVRASASWSGGSLHPFVQNNPKNSCILQSQGLASGGEYLVVESLCSRLCQLLKWEEDVMGNMYDAIMRPTRAAQDSWQNLVSQGPWLYGQARTTGNSEQNNNVRALKDASARSWAVHSRLSAGLQVAVRRLLFLLDARLHREPAMLKQRRSFKVRESRPVSTHSGLLARGPSRTLRQALMMQRQQHARNHYAGSKASLADEVAQATTRESALSVCVRAAVSAAGRESRLRGASASAPPASEGEHQRISHGCAYFHDQQDPAVPLRQDACAEKSFRYPGSVLEAFFAFRAVIDGVAAAWWLQRQLSELTQIIEAAGEVAKIAASALRTTLEEEWTICPFPPSQPPRVSGLFGARQGHGTSGDVGDESFRQLRCTSPRPPSSYQPFGSLSGTMSPANRIALASMSRHIGASLALLRLPWMASSSDGSQKGTLPCPHRCKPTVPDAAASNQSRHPADSREDKGTTNAGDLQLSAFLQLSLRHLRIACEEAEKLQQSLRRAVPRSSVICAQAPKRSIEKISSQTVGALQQGPAEPLRCFEVYTAVGQDCSSNCHKYKEEAALLADFADEDPAVRERSALILQELEVRLQLHQVELQSMPRVLKEFSAAGPLASEGEGHGEADCEGIIRIVEEEKDSTVGLHAPHNCRAEEICDGSKVAFEHSTASREVFNAPKNGTNHFVAQQISETRNTAGPLSRQSGVKLMHESHNSRSRCMYDEGCKEFAADKSLQLRQQVLCETPAIPRNNSEASTLGSLISELRGLLTDQHASCSDGKAHNHCFTSPATTTGESALTWSSVGADDGNCVLAFNRHLVDEEEGQSCRREGRNRQASATASDDSSHARH